MPGNMPPLRPQPEPRVSRTVDSTEPPPPLRLYIEVESQNPPSASASQAFLHRDQQTMLKLVKNIQKTVDELAHDVGDMKRAHEASHALLDLNQSPSALPSVPPSSPATPNPMNGDEWMKVPKPKKKA